MAGILGGIRGLFGGGEQFAKFAGATVGLVGKFVRDKDAAQRQLTDIELAELSAELEVSMREYGVEEKVLDLEMKSIDGVAAQNLADAMSDDPIQRQWRPKASLRLVNLLIGVVVSEYALGLVQMIWFPTNEVEVTFKYTAHLMAGVFGLLGVYMGGRTMEKIKNVAGR